MGINRFLSLFLKECINIYIYIYICVCANVQRIKTSSVVFVVTMHEGASEQDELDLTYCSHKPECIVTANPDRSVLIKIITRCFQFNLRMYFAFKIRGSAWCSKREQFRVLLPLFRHVVPLNDGNCRLKMPISRWYITIENPSYLFMTLSCTEAIQSFISHINQYSLADPSCGDIPNWVWQG